MAFYSPDGDHEGRPRHQGPWRWLAVAAVSAIVGSGTTIALLPALHNGASISTTAPSDAPVDVYTSSPALSTVNVSVNNGITQAVKKVEPAVMGVVNYAEVSDYFTQQTKVQPAGVGTGVLIGKDSQYGYVVTNNHVVQGSAKVEVVLGSGKHVQAQVVGADPYTDLAVLKVHVSAVKSINPVHFANSDAIQVGQPAVAIGTPMGLDFADSVTAGIISAKKRIMPVEDPQSEQVTLDYQAVIQTDAAINPGNSGGPLLDILGNVVGINSSKIVAQSFEGMGFAIPSNEVVVITDQIMKTGHAVHPALGVAGYSMSTIPQQWLPDVPVDYGIFVSAVTSTQAKAAGLRAQDVIVSIDGNTVRSMADLRTYLFEAKPGQTVSLRLYRGSRLMTLQVQLSEMRTQPVSSQSQAGGGSSPDGFGSSVPNWFGNFGN